MQICIAPAPEHVFDLFRRCCGGLLLDGSGNCQCVFEGRLGGVALVVDRPAQCVSDALLARENLCPSLARTPATARAVLSACQNIAGPTAYAPRAQHCRQPSPIITCERRRCASCHRSSLQCQCVCVCVLRCRGRFDGPRRTPPHPSARHPLSCCPTPHLLTDLPCPTPRADTSRRWGRPRSVGRCSSKRARGRRAW